MKRIIIAFLLVGMVAFTYGQSVKSIEATVSNNQIKIDYTISGLKYYQSISNIELYVKKAGDEDFNGPMEFVSGNVESGLRNGQYTMYWDALKEMAIGDDELIFDIRISIEEEDRSRKMMLMLTGNQVTPFGLRLGQLGKTSWYVEARASLQAFEKPQYTFVDGIIIDYEQAGYYEISDQYGWQAYSIILGITKQLHRHLFLYAGAGYGEENYLITIDSYTYDNVASTGSSWVNYEKYASSGIEIDAGIILNYQMFLISAGVTIIDFKTFGWTAGLGIRF